jgi:adenylate kinase
MKLIFVGPQGCGKGTQAEIISKKLNIAHISTGDLLRNLKSQLKKEAYEYMNSGQLVPNEFIIKILKRRISKKDCKSGFILDGFPRDLKQAKILEKITKIDQVINISITDNESVKRISSRLSCPNCKSIFNKITNPPKSGILCDNCQTKLITREDDTKKAIMKRLKIYHKKTSKIIKFYKEKLIEIDGNQKIDKITKDILSSLN